MRFLFTLFLATCAALFTVAAVREASNDARGSWLGSRDLPKGTPIAAIDQKDIAEVIFKRPGGEQLRLQRAEIGWNILDEDGNPVDRADVYTLAKLVDFTTKSRVLDTLPRDAVEPSVMGLGPQAVEVTMLTESGEKLARYLIGRRTPWTEVSDDGKETTPSVYIRHRDPPYKNTVYIVSDPTGDVPALFANGFSTLRDTRPFFFNPTTLRELRVKSDEGEVVLNRPDLSQPWRITRPLSLATDPEAVKTLILDLLRLSATEVSDAAAPLLGTGGQPPMEIGITSFGQESETILTVNPHSPSASSAQATVNDRSAVFTLPLKPTNGLGGLNSIPLTLNKLRFKKLTTLSPQALKSVSITGSETENILLTRNTPREIWQVALQTGLEPTNEIALFELFSALAKDDVAGFATDSAVDLAPYGLDTPAVVITVAGFDKNGLSLQFGRGPDGNIYARRDSQPNIYQISPTTFAKITKVRSKWKDLSLWSISRVDIYGIGIRRKGTPGVLLTYDFISEQWTADSEDGVDITANLLVPKADKFLENLEKLSVFSWLEENDPSARAALKRPVFSVLVFSKNRQTGADEKRTLWIARARQSATNKVFYGRLSSEKFPFILSLKTVQDLATPLFEE